MKAFLGCLLTALIATSLQAHVRSAEFGTRIFTPGPQIASSQDAWSLFTNPAGLAFVGGAELVGGYSYHWMNPNNVHMTELSAAFGLFEGFSVGLGLDLALPNNTSLDNQGLINGQLALAYRFGRFLSLGTSVLKQRRYALSESDPFLFGFGAQYYPLEWLAIGATAKQIDGSFGSPWGFQAGVSVRPFGEQFTIFGETRFWPSQITPITGARLDLEGFSLIGSAVIQENPLFMFAVDINWDHFGFGPIGGNEYVGGRFKISSETKSSIAPAQKQWVQIDLNSDGMLDSKSTSLLSQFFKKPVSPLFFLDSLNELAKDPRIEGVYITLDSLKFGFGRAEELRNSFVALKNSNKQVVIYLNNPSVVDYYVATAAHKIYLNPSGELSLDRFRKTLVYFKKGLDELGVEAEVISAGQYKSAPRPLIANAPNAQELEVANAILDEQYNHFIEAVIQKSQGSREQTKTLINLGILTSQEALAGNLVDALFWENDAPELKKHYVNYFGTKKKIDSWGIPNQIAIIPISGTIVSGSPSRSIGFHKIKQARMIRLDRSNKRPKIHV